MDINPNEHSNGVFAGEPSACKNRKHSKSKHQLTLFNFCFKQVIFDTKAALRRDDIDPKEAMKKTVLVKPGTTNPYECVNKNTVLQ